MRARRLHPVIRAGIALLALALIAGTVLLVRGRTSGTTLTIYFARTDGVYAGDEVRVLGVPVGHITDKIGRAHV